MCACGKKDAMCVCDLDFNNEHYLCLGYGFKYMDFGCDE